MKGEGLVRYIQFLPVLNIVKENPLRAVYKPKLKPRPKPKPKPKPIKHIKRPEPHIPVIYNCLFCDGPVNENTSVGRYCSVECKKLQRSEYNKNPYKIYKTEGHAEHISSAHVHYVDSDILAQAELYADCAEETNSGYTAYIQEDIEDLHMILRSEYALMDAKYEKRPKAKYSGKKYWEAKTLRNHHRKRTGAPTLQSIRYSNFGHKVERWHQEKRGESVKSVMPTEAEIESPTGFVNITSFKTKSGKTPAEILDIVARKKLEKQVKEK